MKMTAVEICGAVLSMGVLFSATALAAQDEMRAAYVRAEALQRNNISSQLHGMSVQPNWIDGQSRFWYRTTGPKGSEFVLVDAERNTRQPAFDHRKLAAGLSALTGKKHTPDALPMQRFEFSSGGRAIRMQLDSDVIECELRRYQCSKLPAAAAVRPGEVASPDGAWAAFVRDHNLFLRSLRDGRELRLTTDGIVDHAYGERPDSFMTSLNAKKYDIAWPARVLWSPDSTKLITYRVDQRQVPPMPYVQWAPEEGYGARPKVNYLRMPMAGDEHVPMSRLVFFDLGSSAAEQVRRIDGQADPIQMPYDLIYDVGAPWWGSLWWDRSSRHTYHLVESRDFRRLQLVETDATTGASRNVLEDFSATSFRFDFRQLPRGFDGSSVVWPSEKDGWQHLYLHDIASGRELAQLTRGEWRVEEVVHVDQKAKWIYFRASGREPGMDLYYFQLYRVKPDGSGLTRLTPDDAQHEVSFSPDGRY
ncbi:DPP IV N-terminal domain-containing protein, partial [Steroidobacter sp.]|uniref:DPP IV N-terminal domain-containing protein n=1 Tax=Steroidobacter sp. TaxID=1978227 RepID=UPI001A46DDA7